MKTPDSPPSDPTLHEGKVRPDSPYPEKKIGITRRDALREEAMKQILKDQDGVPGKQRTIQNPGQVRGK